MPSPHTQKGSKDTPAPEESEESFEQGAIAGPSSPSRRRRRPSTSRRRSSSISAANSLMSSSYPKPSSSRKGQRNSNRSKNGTRNDPEDYEEDEEDYERRKRPDMDRKGTSDASFAAGAAETFQEAREALENGRASPYHMALVTFLDSLAQGMPLASMFKEYSYAMCRIHQDRQTKEDNSLLLAMLPPAPDLPSDPICQDAWVQKATSTYAAAMATVGALLGLVLLDRCNRLSRRFGRKPLMLLTHFLIALAFIFFRVSIALPTYVAAAVLYIAVMVLEASAGAPLRIAIQNYVVDTTAETQRAGALSFIDGFGQLGAFPSATLGGVLAAVSQQFFAPFYATVTIYIVAFAYILIFIPESKENRHHTLIDDWEHGAAHQDQQDEEDDPQQGKQGSSQVSLPQQNDGTDGDTTRNTQQREASYISTVPSESVDEDQSWWQQRLHRLNFLAPLSVFIPRKGGEDGQSRDWRLFNLASIVVFEESFQVFLVPTLLLYNSEVFRYDVVQNGYLVSLLQGTRALYLTAIFPPLVSWARHWIGRRYYGKVKHQQGERQPLLSEQRSRISRSGRKQPQVEARDMAAEEEEREDAQSVEGQDPREAKREERGKLDVTIMLVSYLLCMASFVLLCTSRAQKDAVKLPAWAVVGVSIVGIQLGAGATSVRTALIVNVVGEESEQSKALAANQILCTGIYAIVPLVTSSIFGWGLQMGRPELVWAFKAVMAGLAGLSTLFLFGSYRQGSRREAIGT